MQPMHTACSHLTHGPNTVPPRSLYGIVGFPLSHSQSPYLHTWGFGLTGWPGAYFAWEKAPDALSGFMQAVRTLPLAGLSVTLPHKESILPFLDTISKEASLAGAVNTLYWQDESLCGTNTDLAGFLTPLQGLHLESALVLGAGGVARAALAGLTLHKTPKVSISARNITVSQTLALEYGCAVLPWEQREEAVRAGCFHLVVNATPLGMRGKNQEQSPLPPKAWPLCQPDNPPFFAYDLVYTPLHTCFLRNAAAQGWQMIDGLTMFIAQGLAQFRLWTGHDLPFADARTLILSRL